MDEMDYVMHSSEPSAPQVSQVSQVQPPPGAGAAAGAGAAQQAQQQAQSAHGAPPPHPQHLPQPSGCPYFRVDHRHSHTNHQNHFHYNPSSLPPQHPPLPQQSHAILPQSQSQIQNQGPIPSFFSQSPNRNNVPHQHIAHPHYDPVHAANSHWFPTFQWTSPNLSSQPPLHHHTRTPSSDAYYPLGGNLGSGQAPGPGSGLGAGGPGGVPGGSGVPGISAGGLLPGQPPHQLSHQDPFTPFFYRPTGHQFGRTTAPMSSHNQNHASGASQPGNSDRAANPAPIQPGGGPQQQQSTPHGINLSAFNTAPPPPLHNMSGSGESNPDIHVGRGPLFANRGGPSRSNGNSATSTDQQQTPSASSLFGGSEPAGAEGRPTGARDSPESIRRRSSSPPSPQSSERRRPYPSTRPPIHRLSSQNSDYDSDEDPDQLDQDRRALRFIEQISAAGTFPRDMGEAQVRAHQILRGQLPTKRVASKRALSQLQSVDMDTLGEEERTCVICYNEFGVENPEGINEAPLRLPSCKHVFGDHCIKKWFEDSDSCPYCRDKVPSEPIIASGAQYIRDLYRQYPNARGPQGRPGLPFSELGISRVFVRADGTRFDPSQQRWQGGGRRSPPAEPSEPRRRTRPRHSNFRASPSTGGAHGNRQSSSNTGNSGSVDLAARARPQMSSAHERSASHGQRPFSHHPVAGSNMGRPLGIPPYQSMEPLGLNPPPPPMGSGPPQAGAFGPYGPYDYQGPPAGMAPGTEPPLPGPAQLDAYSQQLPSSASLPPVMSNAADHHQYGFGGDVERAMMGLGNRPDSFQARS